MRDWRELNGPVNCDAVSFDSSQIGLLLNEIDGRAAC